ncbi:MAG: hypothetical protein ACOC2F_06465, partial [Bacteroidota bacterium]
SNKEGPSATIMGNTVPADTKLQGTLSEGIYNLEFKKYKGDPAFLIEKGTGLPTVNGNPNNKANYYADGTLKPISEHIIDGIYFHKGNKGQERLWYIKDNGEKGFISEGCQTGPNGYNSLPRYLQFMKNIDESFKGKYYLRGK